MDINQLNKMHSVISNYNEQQEDLSKLFLTEKLVIAKEILSCKSHEDIEKYIKGLSEIYNSNDTIHLERTELKSETFNNIKE